MKKRLIKFVISIVFWALSWLIDQMRRMMGKELPGTCVVLCYHAVTSEQRNRFARQMDALIRWAKPISADATGPLKGGINHVAVTFDDGFVSVIDNAIPELTQRSIPSTLFIPTGYLGRHPIWINEVGHEDRHEVIITAGQIRSLNKELISIGSHSVTHPDLLLLSKEDAKEELSESKLKLEAIVERPVGLFAFPHGAYNKSLAELSRQAGYKRVFTIIPKRAFSEINEYVTGRIDVSPNDWFPEFRLKMMGAYRWLPIAFNLKRKMYLFLGRYLALSKDNEFSLRTMEDAEN